MNCMKLATLYKITLDELVYKPLSEAKAGEFSSDKNKICGILDIDENGAINLPEALHIWPLFQQHSAVLSRRCLELVHILVYQNIRNYFYLCMIL